MKFSDIIKVNRTVSEGQKGWHGIDEIAKELGTGVDYARIKVKALVKAGRVEGARITGSVRKVYRIIK